MSRDRAVDLLAGAALRQYPAEAAALLDRMRAREVADFLARRDAALAAGVLARLRADQGAEVIEALEPPAASAVLAALEPAVAASLVARLDDDARRARLATLDAALARELADLMTYPPGVTGAVMDPRVTAFRPATTAREALTRIRALKNTDIRDVFLVDDGGQLRAAVGIQDLARADPGARLDELAQPTPRIQALDPQDELVPIAEDRRVTSVPVVDVAGRLVGVIRYGGLLAATQRDATADLATMVGVSKEERALSSVWFAVRKRLPWLQINLATAFLASAVVGLFEDTIARVTALAVLLPVVAGQSGNTGAQALAVTMRGLALREIRVRHWWRVGRKELFVGAINGVAVAALTALAVFWWSGSAGIAGVIGVSMVASMVIAGVAGVSVPMALILLKQDPAAASSIVLTTVTDVMGFLTFLGLAALAAGLL
jgi:magnesium transporter